MHMYDNSHESPQCQITMAPASPIKAACLARMLAEHHSTPAVHQRHECGQDPASGSRTKRAGQGSAVLAKQCSLPAIQKWHCCPCVYHSHPIQIGHSGAFLQTLNKALCGLKSLRLLCTVLPWRVVGCALNNTKASFQELH